MKLVLEHHQALVFLRIACYTPKGSEVVIWDAALQAQQPNNNEYWA